MGYAYASTGEPHRASSGGGYVAWTADTQWAPNTGHSYYRFNYNANGRAYLCVIEWPRSHKVPGVRTRPKAQANRGGSLTQILALWVENGNVLQFVS